MHAFFPSLPQIKWIKLSGYKLSPESIKIKQNPNYILSSFSAKIDRVILNLYVGKRSEKVKQIINKKKLGDLFPLISRTLKKLLKLGETSKQEDKKTKRDRPGSPTSLLLQMFLWKCQCCIYRKLALKKIVLLFGKSHHKKNESLFIFIQTNSCLIVARYATNQWKCL